MFVKFPKMANHMMMSYMYTADLSLTLTLAH